MPSRGSYQIASQDERKAAQRDQSYRSCVATLLIFFMLCIVILIACIPWSKYSTSQYNKKTREGTTETHTFGNKSSYQGKPTEPNVVVTTATAETTADKSVDIFTQNYVHNNDTNEILNRYYKNCTTVLRSLETYTSEATSDSMTTRSDDINSTNSQNQNETAIGKVETTKQPELRNDGSSITYLYNNYKMSESDGQEETSTTTEVLMTEVTGKNSYKTETYIETSDYSTISKDTTPILNSGISNQNISEDLYASTEKPNNTETTILQTTFFKNSSKLFTDTTVNNNNSEISQFTTEISTTYELPFTSTYTDFTNATVMEVENVSTQETVITEEKGNYITNMQITTESNVITTSTTEDVIKTCNSGHCKQVAAKMLSYMNHSADPCEDFYEYACGGMIADPQIIDLNLADKAYHRIARHIRNNNNDTALLFIKYYNSCMQYENTINIKDRITLVKEAINRVGKFYTIHDKVENYGDFTTMYATLLNYSSLLFDVEPDLNEYNPNLYTIRIGPVLHKNLFNSENIDNFCNINESETQQSFVDLESIYERHTKCKQNNRQFIKSINEALTVLGVFNDTGDIEQNVDNTALHIDTEIVQKFFSQFPSQAKIREAYSMKNYSRVLMAQLNKTTTFINWDRLMFLLMKNHVEPDAYVQIYFNKELESGLQQLEKFWKKSPMNFHNAVLGLYAHQLYHDLVISKHEDLKQHCFRISTNLLGPEASSLYMSSFSGKEIAYMNRTIRTFFDELKETLKIKIRTINWIKNEHRQTLLTKINDLSLSVPETSYFQYEKNSELYLSDNYINNSLILMRRYRSSIYSVIPTLINPNAPKQIWTRYATPFQSKSVAVYGLNLVIIPFGAIDYGNMFTEIDETLSNYLIWATIGNLIARQISQHFDVNGIYYWNQTRHNNHLLMSSDGNEDLTFANYINCQKNIYEDQINMTLPLTSQTISFKISEHTLNARLSEIMGLRLMYNTLERLKLFSKNHLPWLKLNVKQLFYLTYAQMYCTKSLLTTSYVSLYENEELPNRIRVFVFASNDDLLGKSWNCPRGSQILPSDTCNVFPHLEHNLPILSA